MESTVWWMLIAFSLTANFISTNSYFPLQEKKKCIHTKVHKLSAADCHGLNLPAVPNHLNPGIEILDLSFNRIRSLRQMDFYTYHYLRFLYLGDNLISVIENATFSYLPYLEVVNISLNAIQVIPHELFHLTNLRKLTLDFNMLNEDSFNELQDLPDMTSLNYLSLSNCRLRKLPLLSKFPHIDFLNVSGNSLTSITIEEIAVACNLLYIDISDNTELLSELNVSCGTLKSWTDCKNIKVLPSLDKVCSSSQSGTKPACTNNVSMDNANNLYADCKATFKHMKEKQTWYKIGLIVCPIIAIVVVVIAFVAYCYVRRKSSRNVNVEPSNYNGVSQNSSANKNLLNNLEHTDI